MKLLSHDASELEPTLTYLLSLPKNDFKLWEMRYVLLLWIGLICLIPFDLAIVDSGSQVKIIYILK